MTGEKMAIIINSPSYDRVSYALTIASISAAHLKEVHVLFTYGAIRRLVKGKVDEVGGETDKWIRKDIKNGLEKSSIKRVSEMISYLKGFGGKIYICAAAMRFHNINKNDLIDEIDEVIGLSTFIEKTDGAVMLYI